MFKFDIGLQKYFSQRPCWAFFALVFIQMVVVKAACFKGIVCLEHMLHLVVKEALGLGSTVRTIWEIATLEL